MRSLRIVLLALTVAVAILAAGRAQEPAKLPKSPYYPLEVDTTWHYKAGGNRFQMKVAKHEKVGGAMCARVELIIDKKALSFEHIGQAGNYLARYTFEGKEAKPPVPFLELNPKKGDRWKIAPETKIGDGQTIKGEFVVGEEEVTVPAGKYKTFTVTGQDMEVNGVKLTCTYYFAEGVGMVKQVLEMAGTKVVIELEKFEAGKSG